MQHGKQVIEQSLLDLARQPLGLLQGMARAGMSRVGYPQYCRLEDARVLVEVLTGVIVRLVADLVRA